MTSPAVSPRPPRCLTIAGSDSGGGAGIQADLATFLALGVRGTSAITSVTSQNTLGVTRIDPVPPAGIAAQIEAVLSDIGADAVKIGMVGNEGAIRAVSSALAPRSGLLVVLDPVMIASSGDPLLEPSAVRALVEELFPLAALLTPNLDEASALLGEEVDAVSAAGAEKACRALAAKGPRAVLLKGAHAPGDTVRDWLWNGETMVVREHPRRAVPRTHGTGCTLSSAIAAHLALGAALDDAVARALDYVDGALLAARPIGGGAWPLDHGWALARRSA